MCIIAFILNQMFKTAYFPGISVMQAMVLAGEIILDTAEHYQKNSTRNRCYLASAQGKILLSVPLIKGKHEQMPIRDVRIAYDFDWCTQHIRTMGTGYRRAPFYEYFIDDIRRILFSKPVFLIDLNWEILLFICKSFHWNPSISCSLAFEKSNDLDFLLLRTPVYPQVFENKIQFIADLSILDLMFCIGPQIKYLSQAP